VITVVRHLSWFTHLEVASSVAAPLLAGDPGRWLPAPAEPVGEGWRVDLEATGALPSAVARRAAFVTVGPASGDVTSWGGPLLRAISWRAAGHERWFPVLDGDLELVSLGGGGCQLSLLATYRPPLSVVGGLGDGVQGHRVAEACARRFALDVAARLSVRSDLPSPGGQREAAADMAAGPC
jgi:hypothetical protein